MLREVLNSWREQLPWGTVRPLSVSAPFTRTAIARCQETLKRASGISYLQKSLAAASRLRTTFSSDNYMFTESATRATRSSNRTQTAVAFTRTLAASTALVGAGRAIGRQVRQRPNSDHQWLLICPVPCARGAGVPVRFILHGAMPSKQERRANAEPEKPLGAQADRPIQDRAQIRTRSMRFVPPPLVSCSEPPAAPWVCGSLRLRDTMRLRHDKKLRRHLSGRVFCDAPFYCLQFGFESLDAGFRHASAPKIKHS